jgi:hypothetical protein
MSGLHGQLYLNDYCFGDVFYDEIECFIKVYICADYNSHKDFNKSANAIKVKNLYKTYISLYKYIKNNFDKNIKLNFISNDGKDYTNFVIWLLQSHTYGIINQDTYKISDDVAYRKIEVNFIFFII